MKNLPDLLKSELVPVPAPDNLWDRVSRELQETPAPPNPWRMIPIWAVAFAAPVILLLIPGPWLHRVAPSSHALDLQAYVERLQGASGSASAPAVYRTPAHFENQSPGDGPVAVAGFNVTAQRVMKVDGETVRQIIFQTPDNPIALFIASPQVRLATGGRRWVADSLDGVACQRLNCPLVRTVQFPCAKQVCVLVCKTCTEDAMRALMTEVEEQPLEFR